MAKFSVIIPLYNKQESIRKTVESILAQTFTDFELVIVNDGSKDKSLEIVNSIEDSRIVIVDKPNGGVSSARNAGIEKAMSEWVSFIDADDYWNPHYLETVKTAIEKYPAASVVVTNYKKGEENPYVEYQQEGYMTDYFLLAMKYNDIICSSVITCKKACFDTVGLFSDKYYYGEDLNMWSRLADNFLIAYIPEVLAEYRIEAENRLCNTKIDPRKSWELHLTPSDFKSVSWPLYYHFRISSSFVHYLRYGMFANIKYLVSKYGIVEVLKSLKYRRLL